MSAIEEFRELAKEDGPVSLTHLGALTLLNEINALQRQAAPRPLALQIFDATFAEGDLEELLDDVGLEDVRHGHDYYDYSIELYDMEPSFRLSGAQQEALAGAGFAKCCVNHVDKWETHYTWKVPFESVEGWRVSYPHKRGTDNSRGAIWVERRVASWPTEWFDTGYAIVKESGT